MRRLARLALLIIAIAGCSQPLDLVSGLGAERERAVAAALAEQPPGTRAGWAARGPLGLFVDAGFLPEEPRGRVVWAVLILGQQPGGCVMSADGPKCPPRADSKLVLLDASTLAFFASESPSHLEVPPAGAE